MRRFGKERGICPSHGGFCHLRILCCLHILFCANIGMPMWKSLPVNTQDVTLGNVLAIVSNAAEDDKNPEAD